MVLYAVRCEKCLERITHRTPAGLAELVAQHVRQCQFATN